MRDKGSSFREELKLNQCMMFKKCCGCPYESGIRLESLQDSISYVPRKVIIIHACCRRIIVRTTALFLFESVMGCLFFSILYFELLNV